MNFKKIIVTGGAGFIGGAVVRKLLTETNALIYNVDKISYASDFTCINQIKSSKERHFLHRINLVNKNDLEKLIYKIRPDLIIHLAAETHVDRSIENPSQFVESNIIGTFNLLEVSTDYWKTLDDKSRNNFRFHHVSTDEVFGSLGPNEYFNESSNYAPMSPYSASKASSDHLVRSWHNTFGLPTLISNCSNNYGPFQFPEKLIPLTITKALKEEKIPIYGDGQNIRDWLFVDDHVDAIFQIITKGKIGKSYCIGGNNPMTNLEVVEKICSILDIQKPKIFKHKDLIEFVKDRPGHDIRYAIDTSYIKKELYWEPKYKFEKAIEETVIWYLENPNWCIKIMKKGFYKGGRIGLKKNQK